MQSQQWYEVIQVVSRWSDGRVKGWWPGDKQLGGLEQDKGELKAICRDHPGVEYAIVEMVMTEIGEREW